MMENLIQVVNLLQDASTRISEAGGSSNFTRLDLPQIAVVGSQSSGKSSVLESFVGKDFLPRGSGIVTRRPLILQLLRHNGAEYGEFSHKPGAKFYDFNQIMLEIQQETDRMTGTDKGISPIPINLKLYSPNVLDLTLVDLPGMTKIAVGDQPPDIEIQIRNMILQFISSEKCLILAVCPANADLANSDALQIAKEVDPTHDRTIGVLTKLDLMDDGTHAGDALDNKLYQLKYGYIGVVNRSQKDLDSRKDVHAAAEAERRFFLGHPVYRKMADKMGSTFLQKTLNQHLLKHISDNLPELRSELQNAIDSCRKELELLHFSDRSNPNWQITAAILQLTNFAEKFSAEIFGNSSDDVDVQTLTIGAEIRYLFHVWYPYQIAAMQRGHNDNELKRIIGVNILNAHGVRAGLFAPDAAFQRTVMDLIFKMNGPTNELLAKIRTKIETSVEKCLEPMGLFPNLFSEVRSMVNLELMNSFLGAERQVQMLLDCERAYLNLNHEDFIGMSIFEGDQVFTIEELRGRRKNPQREIVHEGPLAIGSVFGSKLWDRRYLWFVLTCDSLTWYADQEKKDRLYAISMNDIKLNVRLSTKSRVFILCTGSRKKNVYKSSPELELTAMNQGEMEEWVVKLMDVGVGLEDADSSLNLEDDYATNDPLLKNNIEKIFVIVDSYLRVVRQNLQDKVPKCIVFTLFMALQSYVKTTLIGQVCRKDLMYLMAEDEKAADKRNTLKLHYDKCMKAMESLDTVKLAPIRPDPKYNAKAAASRQRNQPAVRRNVTKAPAAPGRPPLPASVSNPSIHNRTAPPLPSKTSGRPAVAARPGRKAPPAGSTFYVD